MAPLPSFLLLLLLLTLLSLSSAHFSPSDHLLLSCGATTATTTLPDRRLFLPDNRILHSVSAIDPSSPPDSLYATARVFLRPSFYKLQVKQHGTHILRLHFLPFLRLHSSRFHVLTSGSVLIRDISFDCMDKGATFPLVKEFIIQVDSDELVITFAPVGKSDLAFVSAIEFISVPSDLVPEAARLVEKGSVANLNGVSKGKFETLFRVNVGGAKVTSFNDTLWRTWLPDEEFVVGEISGSKSMHFSGRIQYQTYGASREIAPDHVYNTARVMSIGDAAVDDQKKSMSWGFKVNYGHKYLIRLHFCDIASLALNELYFNVFINGDMAYEDLDISEATGRILAAPYYVDFVASTDDSGRVVVTIMPSKLSAEFKIQGLLNGLEIMKMNNSVGNLDGDVPVELVLATREERAVGGFAPFVLCGVMFSCLLAAGFILVSLWKSTSKSRSSGWSLLPIDAPDGKLAYEIPMTAGKTPYF